MFADAMADKDAVLLESIVVVCGTVVDTTLLGGETDFGHCVFIISPDTSAHVLLAPALELVGVDSGDDTASSSSASRLG